MHQESNREGGIRHLEWYDALEVSVRREKTPIKGRK